MPFMTKRNSRRNIWFILMLEGYIFLCLDGCVAIPRWLTQMGPPLIISALLTYWLDIIIFGSREDDDDDRPTPPPPVAPV